MSHDPCIELIGKLTHGGFDPRPTGPDSWDSRCPSHNGSRRNLSIKRGDDNRALIHCHHEPACDPAAIVAPLGMSLPDLFPHDPSFTPPTNAKPPRRAHPSPEVALARLIRDRGQPTAIPVYQEADASEAFRVYRFDSKNSTTGEPEKDFRPVHLTADGWIVGDPDGPLPLYHLPELADADRVFIAEGEKACDRVHALGLVCTTSAHGAQSPHKSDWSPLAGKDVVILPDHDKPGEGYSKAVIGHLARLNPRPRVKVVRMADLWRTDTPIPEGGDVAEWLVDGVPESWTESESRDELERLAVETPEVDLDTPCKTGLEADSCTVHLDWPADPKPSVTIYIPSPVCSPTWFPSLYATGLSISPNAWVVRWSSRRSPPLWRWES